MAKKFVLVCACFIVTYLSLLMVPAKSKNNIPFYKEKGVANIAHRNGHALMPANTVEAGLNALQVGADILEIDIHLTADKRLVVRHDEVIDTTTDGIGRISEMTFSEIEKYNAKFHEVEYPHKLSPLGIKIPALTALFQRIPSARYLIEIKPQDNLASERLCAVVREYKLTEQVLVGSFHTSVLEHFRRICPEVPTSHGQSEVRLFYVLIKLGLGHLYDPPGYSMQLPISYQGFEIVTPRLLKVAHSLNLKVEIWTINDIETSKKLITLGVDGIITDRPDLIDDLLDI